MSVKVRPLVGQPGVWEVDVYLRLPDDSIYRKRIRSPASTRAASERFAQEHAAHVLKTWNQPKPAEPKEVKTIAQFKESYLEHARARRQKPSTIDTKESLLKTHILPLLGEKRLDQVTDTDVATLMASMKELSPKTVNNNLTVLNKLLKLAVKAGEISRMPVAIELLDYEPPEMRFYEFEEYQRGLDVAREHFTAREVAILLLGADAGLRCGEMIALEKNDADHRRGILNIQRSEWRGAVTLPKGGKPRKVPMTKRLSEALRAIEHLRGPRFFYRDGVPPRGVTEQVLRGWIAPVQRRAKLYGGETEGALHILRHTFCSHLAMRGASPKAIQELAGHVSITTTMRYMHLAPSEKSRAIALLEQPLPKAAEPWSGDGVPAGAGEKS